MLFNYKREGYLAGRGSIVMEVLPEEIKEDVVTEGNICIAWSKLQTKLSIPLNGMLLFLCITKCKLVLLHVCTTGTFSAAKGSIALHEQ